MSDDPDVWRRQCVTEGGVLVGTATGWHCRSMPPPACALCGGWYGGPGCYGQCEQTVVSEDMNAYADQRLADGTAFDERGGTGLERVQEREASRDDVAEMSGVGHPTPTTAAVDPKLERKQARRQYRLECEARSYERGYVYGVQVGKQVAREQMMREQAACVWPGSRGSEAAGKAAAVSKARQRQSKAKQKQEEDKQSK